MDNQEYAIINKTAVLKRMERLEEFVKSISDSDDSYEFVKLGVEDVLSNSIPLIPEIEKDKFILTKEQIEDVLFSVLNHKDHECCVTNTKDSIVREAIKSLSLKI